MLLNYRNFFMNERFLIGTSILRICIGLILLFNYFIHYKQRYFFWHESGINIYSAGYKSLTWSLYNLNSSALFFDFIYHLGIIVTIFYLIGYKGRLFSILAYLFFYSLYVRSFHISDGGDNLLIVNMFFLSFANNTAYLSLDSKMNNSSGKDLKDSLLYKLSVIIHNFAVLFCIIQLCIVYFFSGMYQLMGEMWQNGTALYYISQVREFSRPILDYMVNHYVGLTIVFTYLSIIVKIAFPFAVINKSLKPFVVIAMILFHAGIGIGMGLLTFSLIMIVMELLLFTDREYKKLYHFIKISFRKISIIIRRKTRKIGYVSFQHKQILVFYDGWCPVCTNIKDNLYKLDYFRLLRLVSFRNSSLVQAYKLDVNELERRMHSFSMNDSSKIQRGIDSIAQICTRIPYLWWAVPFIIIFKKMGIGGCLYDYIASKRKVIPVGNCDDLCELQPKRVH
ncbi:vitamin K-dependent gamma-carboxylase [Paenibacillus polymyxa]|nr:vitamin K-dependent gamma-carboxylase [Paenibacillus polymyxa]